MKRFMVLVTTGVLLSGVVSTRGESEDNLRAEIRELQNRITELESQVSSDTYQQRNAELIQQMIQEFSANPGTLGADSNLTAGYKKRFYIKSTDDQFKLEFDTRLQFRHYYSLSDDGDNKLLKDGTRPSSGDGVDSSASGFEMERVRLYLSGHVLKDWKYKIGIAMGDDTVDGGADSGSTGNRAQLHEYTLSHAFSPEFGLKIGRYKGAFGKQENTSSGRLTFVDRSLANEVFNLSRMEGVEVFGQTEIDSENNAHYRLGIYNGLQGDNNENMADHDNSPAVAARLTIPLSGATPNDFKNESDLAQHENPVSQVGFSAAWSNDRDEDHFAGGESDSYEFLGKSAVDGRTDIFELGGEMTMFGADYSYKHQGLSINLEGFIQCIDVDSGEVANESDFGNSIRSGIDGHQYDNYGWTAQAGQFVSDDFELICRASGVCVDSSNDSHEYAAGWNWYIAGQDLKLSMDVTYIDDLPLISTSPQFDGVQNNSLFLIRTQLQFMF
jgi:hypothetical protein